MSQRYTPAELRALRRGLEAGRGIADIARRMGRDRKGLYHRARREGWIEPSRRFLTDEETAPPAVRKRQRPAAAAAKPAGTARAHAMTTLAHRLRQQLADGPATSAELTLALHDVAAPMQVRSAVATEYLGGRIQRTGTPRKYQYTLTDLGRRAVANPAVLCAGSRRRTKYHRIPTPPRAAGGST